MAYQSTITSTIQLATESSDGANLNNLLFVTTNSYFSNRMKGYSTFEEVKSDASIPSTSIAYAGLRLAFSQPGVPTPVYLGRRQADSVILTPTSVSDNKTYGVTVSVTETATGIVTSTVFSIDSGASATADTISEDLQAEISATGITCTDGNGYVTIVATTGYTFTISSQLLLADTYTTTEAAADLLTGLQEENNEDWYFLCCDDHSETFATAMAVEIEATESSDYPKQYHVSFADTDVLTPLPEVAIDVMGKLKETGYTRTRSIWHNDADTLIPEIADVAYNGQYTAGSTTWKFMSNLVGVDAIINPATGYRASTALQGYIADRNGNWHAKERKVNFAHGGKMVGGEWCDTIRGKDYLNDRIETELLNLMLNQVGGKIPNTPKGHQMVVNVIDGVLQAAVELNILSGYIGASVPTNITFADQAARILRDVNWTGYLAGAVHFAIVNGVLTYQDADLV